jgi:hypothetical protein
MLHYFEPMQLKVDTAGARNAPATIAVFANGSAWGSGPIGGYAVVIVSQILLQYRDWAPPDLQMRVTMPT